jgi:hypothetical protein
MPEEEKINSARDGDDPFPSGNAPVLFADGIISHAWGSSVSKFYLYRTDPSFRGTGEVKNSNVAQIVMPNTGLAEMAAFLERRVSAMVKAGIITVADVNTARKAVGLETEFGSE